MPRCEVLHGLPPVGPLAHPFGAGGIAGAWTGHSEGLVVRFYPKREGKWVANFQPGHGGWNGVLHHPDGEHIVVVTRGQVYVVEPEKRQLTLTFPGIEHVVEIPELNAIVFSDGIRFEAIKSDGIWWTSRRVSWDEIRNIKIQGTALHGEASIPNVTGNEWAPFTLDLTTGQCEGGSYWFKG
jgi:hypothetical protein